jgi:hypothetical protein
MNDEKKHIVIKRPHKEGSVPIWFAILDVSQYWCDWKLIRCGVIATEDGHPAHYGEGCWPSEECTDIEAAEPTLSGFIKWDGCMEFCASHGTEEHNQIHVCDGPASAWEMFAAWNWLLTEAHKAMVDVGADPNDMLWEPLDVAERLAKSAESAREEAARRPN